MAAYFVKVRKKMKIKIVYKRILAVVSIVLIAVLLNFIGKEYEVKAGGAKPDFDATIKCYGNFYGWDADTPTDMTASVHVSDYGEYSVSFAAPATVEDLNEMSGIFVIETDLKGEPALYPFTLCAKTARIGNKIYDWSKAVAYLDGDIKMSIHNEWGAAEKDNPLSGWAISVDKGDIMTFTFEVKEGAPAPTFPTEAPAKYYNAYLGFQVADTGDYRNEYEKDINSTDYNFTTQARIGGEATDVNKVKIKNATITGSGTYSVSMTGADLSAGPAFNMLFISTDIPAREKDVKFSDIKVIIDGRAVTTLKEGIVKQEVQNGFMKYYMIMAVNVSGKSGVDLPKEFQYKMPKNSVELQFRVDFEGNYFNQDNVQNGKKKQAIHAKSVTKEYGSKSFRLKANSDSYGALSYSSSNKKAVTVNKSGRVTIKGYGKSTITIKAPETEEYKSAKKKITVTVIPKKVAVKSLKSLEAERIRYSWKADKTVDGYQVYGSQKKDFSYKTFQRFLKSASISLHGLKSGKRYYFKVRAYKKVGKNRYYGKWSKVKKIKVR